MTAIRKSYDKEFKPEAIRLAESSGHSMSLVEREQVLSKCLIFRWRHSVARNDQED